METKIRYELKRAMCEVSKKEVIEIGFQRAFLRTIVQGDYCEEPIGSFDTIKDAKRAFGNLAIEVLNGNSIDYGSFFLVTNVFVEENEYDKDGKPYRPGEVWFSVHDVPKKDDEEDKDDE